MGTTVTWATANGWVRRGRKKNRSTPAVMEVSLSDAVNLLRTSTPRGYGSVNWSGALHDVAARDVDDLARDIAGGV
jgi:hypothetical protein